MNQEELQKLLDLLSDAGWNPLICDTDIPIVDNPVFAGNPRETGDDTHDYIKVPRALLSWTPEMMVKVKGDSMVDAEVNDGDYVKMKMEQTARNGDIVVVAIGREVTLKVYYEDEDGNHWLVPQNKERRDIYKPILLDGRNEDIIIHSKHCFEVGTRVGEQHPCLHRERLTSHRHRSRRADRHPVSPACPLDDGRCGNGDSREWHHQHRLVRHVTRLGALQRRYPSIETLIVVRSD